MEIKGPDQEPRLDIPRRELDPVHTCKQLKILILSIGASVLGHTDLWRLVGWFCFMSHRQWGQLETAPPFTVPCEGREAQ